MNLLKKLPFYRNYTTTQWTKWWKKRQIDWKTDYMMTWKHPHRYIISGILKTFSWISLYEVGCGGGANIVNIFKQFENVQLGGCDINPEAIKLLKESFNGGRFEVCSADDVMMSDSSTDVVLTDMCLIYTGPGKINKQIEEIKRIARNWVLFCEFHSDKWYERLWLRLRSGLNAYDYTKLLTKHGFYDIELYKIPNELWPDVSKNNLRFIIKAKIIK